MIKVQSSDGRVYSAATAREVVEQMRAASFEPETDLGQWMEQTAGRVQMQTGELIHPSNPATFLDDLKRLGLLSDVDLAAEGD